MLHRIMGMVLFPARKLIIKVENILNWIYMVGMYKMKLFERSFRMRKPGIVLVILFGSLLALSVFADETKTEATKETKVVFKNQTHCPVMGGKIDSTVYTDIQGQRVYHCCPMCSKKLKADPDKYFEKAAEEGILFENIQTACPVSGKEIDTSVYVDYNGRRVYFCCEKCKPEFTKKPMEYLTSLDEPKESEKEETGQQGEAPKHKEHTH